MRWEYYLFKEQIFLATAIIPEVAYASEKKIFDRDKFYSLCGMTPSKESWIKVANNVFTEEAAAYLKECFKNALVITQVGGSMKNIFDYKGIPYIDIYVSALKFLEDIHLAFRSNIMSVREKLKKYRLSETYINICANTMKSYYHSRPDKLPIINTNSLLLCGQSDTDLSLIRDGKIITFMDFENKIKSLFKKYDSIYYKKHPEAKENSQNEVFIRSFENIITIDYNFYAIMTHDNLKGVAALSSGTLKEAPYFGKDIHVISHEFINYTKNNDISGVNDFFY